MRIKIHDGDGTADPFHDHVFTIIKARSRFFIDLWKNQGCYETT
jgi:hypothetical protein